MNSIVIVAVIMRQYVAESMAECMAEALCERGNAVTQVYRRMHVEVTRCIASRVDGATETVCRDQRNWRRRMYRNWHRLLQRNRI